MWQRQREAAAASILKCWSRITAKGEWASSIERWKSPGSSQEPGARSREPREHCATSRWARPTEVVSAVRHWMTINFHLIGFIWNSYFSFSLPLPLPLILSSISISITLPLPLSLPLSLSQFSMTAVVFTAVAWHLLQILFCLFIFIVFNDFTMIFRRRCWKFPFTVCHIFLEYLWFLWF